MPKGIGTVCLCLGLFMTALSSADAQYRRPFQAVPRVNRALGHGNGFGYHTCNPGPDSSYYNPWTPKNSFLISQSPEFLSRYGHELNPTPLDLLRAGQTGYGHPAHGQPLHGVDFYAPGTLNADFVPNTRDEGDDENDHDNLNDVDEDEDSVLGDDDDDFSSREEYEDRFDEDAEDIEAGRDPFDEQAEAFEAADDPGALTDELDTTEAATEGANLLNSGGVFLPASYPLPRN